MLGFFVLICGLVKVTFSAVLTPFPDASGNVSSDVTSRSSMSRDKRYSIWPSRIPYKLDPTYTAAELATINQALMTFSSNMQTCITFVPYNNQTNVGQDFIYFGKTAAQGKTPSTCLTFPGRVLEQRGRGQKVAMISGPSGCLGSVRDAMKFVAHVLGLRNEYNRPDRNQYIQIFPQNIRPDLVWADLLKLYTPDQVDYMNSNFDYQSITIPSPQKFANPGTALFSPLNPSQQFGNLAALSLGDCQALSLIYNTCISSKCTDPYPQFTAAMAATSPPTTTVRDPFAGLAPLEPGGGM